MYLILRHFHATIEALKEQQLLHILCVCVFVALGNRDAKRMRHIILSSVAFLTYHIFSPLSNKRPDIQVNVLNIKYMPLLLYNFV
jgi:hypothetical protein